MDKTETKETQGEWTIAKLFNQDALMRDGVLSSITLEEMCQALNELNSLRSELQKAKELNGELVKFVEELLNDYKNHCVWLNFEERAESLIKKSEI